MTHYMVDEPGRSFPVKASSDTEAISEAKKFAHAPFKVRIVKPSGDKVIHICPKDSSDA